MPKHKNNRISCKTDSDTICYKDFLYSINFASLLIIVSLFIAKRLTKKQLTKKQL